MKALLLIAALLLGAMGAARPAAAASAPPLEIGYCIDTTLSVHDALVGPGKALLERHLEAVVRPGFPGLILHLRKIGRSSWGPSAELVTAQIPAVPSDAARPPQPGPFTSLTEQRREQAGYRQAHNRVLRAEAAARRALASVVRQINRVRLAPEQGTDVAGCAAAFSSLWAGMPGPHSLTILSDLTPVGTNTHASIHFTGQTTVTVVLYCADQSDAAACEARGRAFGRQMKQAGATRYQTYDFENIDFVPVPH